MSGGRAEWGKEYQEAGHIGFSPIEWARDSASAPCSASQGLISNAFARGLILGAHQRAHVGLRRGRQGFQIITSFEQGNQPVLAMAGGNVFEDFG
jgi:hypothetical protein